VYIVDYGIGLSYRHSSLCMMPGGPIRKPYTIVDCILSKGLRIWPLGTEPRLMPQGSTEDLNSRAQQDDSDTLQCILRIKYVHMVVLCSIKKLLF
jgi:hypothetical protein